LQRASCWRSIEVPASATAHSRILSILTSMILATVVLAVLYIVLERRYDGLTG
jgi:hypothetical protein